MAQDRSTAALRRVPAWLWTSYAPEGDVGQLLSSSPTPLRRENPDRAPGRRDTLEDRVRRDHRRCSKYCRRGARNARRQPATTAAALGRASRPARAFVFLQGTAARAGPGDWRARVKSGWQPLLNEPDPPRLHRTTWIWASLAPGTDWRADTGPVQSAPWPPSTDRSGSRPGDTPGGQLRCSRRDRPRGRLPRGRGFYARPCCGTRARSRVPGRGGELPPPTRGALEHLRQIAVPVPTWLQLRPLAILAMCFLPLLSAAATAPERADAATTGCSRRSRPSSGREASGCCTHRA